MDRQSRAARFRSVRRFGGLKDKVLERDGYKCVKCGMTQDEHKAKWNRSLTVDHIDRQGRDNPIPNNDMTNLQTLCLICHGKKDHRPKKSRDPHSATENGERNKVKVPCAELAKADRSEPSPLPTISQLKTENINE